jgi:thioester reductase-like protein
LRASDKLDAATRLQSILFYYFENTFEQFFGNRIVTVPGDITDPELFKTLAKLPIDTYINSAANVKHFSAGTDIEDINITGAKNGLDFARSIDAMFVQVSTTSVAGMSINNSPDERSEMTEQQLYFGQDLSNKYIHSKFIAERNTLEAATKGAGVKVIRVGNLMARNSDGEFQANFNTNSFLKTFKAYAYIGKVPYSVLTAPVELAPIDCVAQTILKLPTTPDDNRVFHSYNNHIVTIGDICQVMIYSGVSLEFVEDDEFQEALKAALHDPARSEVVSSLMAYNQGTEGDKVVELGSTCELTTQALLRKGFEWPITSSDYLQKFIDTLIGFGYFEV